MSRENTKHILAAVLAFGLAACGGGGGGGSSGGGGNGSGGSPAPTISTQPAAATVADGAIAQFSVVASGDAPLSYQWRRNGADLADTAGIVGATSATMSLTAPYTYNASQISVRVTNVGGNVVSSNAPLTVTPVAPTIAKQPANTGAAVGTTATLSATITGGTAPVAYQWKRNGTAIEGATSASYAIGAADLRDNAAVFVLDITNPAGTLSTQPAMLTVLPPGTTFIFSVDTTDDLVDVDTADGICLTSANNCSLRAAVMQANALTVPLTDINVPAGTYQLTLPPAGNDGDANGNLNFSAPIIPSNIIFITGAGASRTIIDGNQLDNVLQVGVGRIATLSGLTLRNGKAPASLSGGIVANRGGSLTITDCVIEGGQTAHQGGGIYNTGVLHVFRSTLRANRAGQGGGVFALGPTTLRDSTVSDNHAYDGGGISNLDTAYVVNSTVSLNTADGDGGGIHAAVSVPGSPERVTTAIYSTSIIGNDADHDHDELGGNGGGVFNGANSRFIVVNSLLAANTLRDSPQYADCRGDLEAYAAIMLGNIAGCTFSGSARPMGVVALATIDGLLKDNGGPTFTHALIPGANSPIDAGLSDAPCIDETGTPLTTDQRGAPRVAGTVCDLGAYEYGAVVP